MYKYALGFAALALAFMLSGQAVSAAYLYMEPASKSVAVGESFSVALKINTEGQAVNAADAWINYDGTALSFVDAKEPSGSEKFFSEKLVTKSTTTSLYLASWISFGSDAVKTPPEGFAILNFKAQKAGTFTLDIKCTQGDTRDSAIAARINKKTEDIITCSKVVDATITASGGGGGGVPTATPAPGGSTVTPPVGGGGPSPTKFPTPTGSTRASVTPTPSVRPGSPTPTLAPTKVVTATPTSSPSATLIPTVAGPTASPSALPATGVLQTSAVVLGIGVALTVISIIIKLFIL